MPGRSGLERGPISRANVSSSTAAGMAAASTANAPPLLEELERELRTLIRKFDLTAVAICDREGAFVCKVANDTKPDGLFQLTMLNQKLVNSSENIQKMNFGLPRKILLEYDRYQIMKFFGDKFIVAFVASSQIPTGTLFSLEPDCLVIFQILKDYLVDGSS